MSPSLVRAVIVTFCAFFTISLLAVPASARSAPVSRHAPATAVTTVAAVAITHRHTVRRGDTLAKIARRVLGSARLWPVLWWDNRYKIKNPDAIRIGQHIRYGHWHRLRPWLLRRAHAAIPKPPPPPSPAPAVPHRHHRYHAVAAAAPVSYSGGVISYGGLEALWERAGGPAWAAAAAATIAECESGGNPDAYNPSGATGIWQILGQVVSGNLRDPFVNALNAVSKFRASGDTFAQWVCQA